MKKIDVNEEIFEQIGDDVNMKIKEILSMLPKGYSVFVRGPCSEVAKRRARKSTGVEHTKTSSAFGSFVFVDCVKLYQISQELTPLQCRRLLYLMTFSDYDNILLSTKDNMDVEESLMAEFALQPLGVKTLLGSFCAADALIKQYDGTRHIYRFPRELLFKGKPKKTDRERMADGRSRYIRLYESGVRRVFRVKHAEKAIQYLPRMLVCVHSIYNVLCENPMEQDIKGINPLTFMKACEIMGFKGGYTANIRKVMMESTFMTPQDGKQHVCIQSTEDIMGIPAGAYFINPRICFGGGKEVAQQLEPLFKIKE